MDVTRETSMRCLEVSELKPFQRQELRESSKLFGESLIDLLSSYMELELC